MPKIKYMKRALSLAKGGWGETSPNPMVGAVIVRDGKIIGEGYHSRCGMPHAEVEAIRSAKENLSGAEMYVTLEPCNFYGRTPPCTDAIIKSGIRKVYIATLDPNPRVSGGGVKKLRDAGIDVEVGMLENEAKRLNEIYFKNIQEKLPFVIGKAAITLDGFIADTSGNSRWITSESSRKSSHMLRALVDGILVGAETVRCDNPRLTTYLVEGKTAIRFVLARHPLEYEKYHIFTDGLPTYIITDNPDYPEEGLPDNISLVILSNLSKDILPELWKMNIRSLLVEGGGEVHSFFLENSLYDKMLIFVAPKVIGNGKRMFGNITRRLQNAMEFCIESVDKSGNDAVLTVYKKGKCSQG